MATRVQGVSRVLLYDKGYPFQCAYPGVGIKHRISDAHKQQRLLWSVYNPLTLGMDLIHPSFDLDNPTKTPTVAFYDLPQDRGGVSSAPALDAGQDLDLDWWDVDSVGSWEAIEDPEYPGSIIYQRDGTADTVYTATSKFRLPPYPLIALSLWRGEPSEEQTTAPYTTIRFGTGGNYALVIPYEDQAYLAFYNVTTSRYDKIAPMQGSSVPSIGALGKGQRLWITLMCHDGAIFASFDRGGGMGSWAGWEVPDMEWDTGAVPGTPPHTGRYVARQRGNCVGEGEVRLLHNGSPVAVRWWPIYHPPFATEPTKVVYASPIDAGYPIFNAHYYTWWETETYGENDFDGSISADTCYSFRFPVMDVGSPAGSVALPSETGLDVVVTPIDPNPPPWFYPSTSTKFTWEASWKPAHWILSSVGAPSLTGYAKTEPATPHIHHWSAPFLYATLCTAEPGVMSYEFWPGYTDVTAEVQAVAVDAGENDAIGRLGVKLKNYLGTFANARDGQFITVQLGYLWSDGTNDIADGGGLCFAGYLATPGHNARVGPMENADFVGFDPLIRCRDEKAYGTEPDFQVYSPKDAILWLLARCGIPPGFCTLLGTDTVMRLGKPGWGDDWEAGTGDWRSDDLVPAFGSELLDSMLEYAHRDNQSVLSVDLDETIDGDGDYTAHFKVTKTNGKPGPTDGTLYTLHEDATGAQYGVFSLDVQSVSMDPDHYADTVVVRGRDINGGAVQGSAATLTRIVDKDDENFSGGWHRMHVETRNDLQTAQACSERAAALLAEKSRKSKVLTATVSVIPGIKRGDRIKISRNSAGSSKATHAGILDVEFRIINISKYHEGAHEWPKCELTARTVA